MEEMHCRRWNEFVNPFNICEQKVLTLGEESVKHTLRERRQKDEENERKKSEERGEREND